MLIDVAPKFRTCWAMPSRWTFSIPPVAEFLARHLEGCVVIVDPFAGMSRVGTHRNDLASGGVEAHEFCHALIRDGLVADAVIFDPPYSPRQITECYASVGKKCSMEDTQSGAFNSRSREPLGRLLKRGGIALSFGWQSAGFGKAWPTDEIMLVQHGGAHNDTICVAQRKP